jgi:hypothetical protein
LQNCLVSWCVSRPRDGHCFVYFGAPCSSWFLYPSVEITNEGSSILIGVNQCCAFNEWHLYLWLSLCCQAIRLEYHLQIDHLGVFETLFGMLPKLTEMGTVVLVTGLQWSEKAAVFRGCLLRKDIGRLQKGIDLTFPSPGYRPISAFCILTQCHP